MAGKTIYVQGKDGKMKGSTSLAGKTPPASAPESGRVAPEVSTPPSPEYSAMYAVFQSSETSESPKSTGKQGTDIPPLVVETPAAGRFYVDHPDHRIYAMADIDAALDSGRAFPSVTSVISSFSNDALMKSAVRKVSQAAVDRLEALRAMESDEDRIAALDEWLERDEASGDAAVFHELRDSYTSDRDAAASRGTEVHALVEALSHGDAPEIPEGYRGYVNAYLQFRERFPDVKVKYTEATIINRADGTMGTADAIVEIGGKNYVLDYKTNKDGTVYQKTGMQLAAAANGEAIVYPDGSTEPLPEIAGGIGVGLSPTGKCGVFFFETARNGPNHQGLQAAVAAWRWQRGHRARTTPITRDELDRLN